jgi:arsenite/tail-anchored protein-transporting ATPase
MKIYFFMGKGGVGKSTLSSLTAIYLAAAGHKVLLTSLDPAHNLADIFENDFSDKATHVIQGLDIIETDNDRWIKAFLKQSEKQMTSSYSYLTSFSMEKHFAVMQHAPALEEYALHQAFKDIVEKNKTNEFLLFDMPPTALTLKFFALPQLSLIWLENLVNLRLEIIKKQEIISRLSLGKKTFERDRVLQNIENQQKYWRDSQEILKNKDLSIPVVVENPDQLSAAETQRIIKKMHDLAMPDLKRALNNANSKDAHGFQLVVGRNENPTGLNNLQEIVKSIDFSGLLDDTFNKK